MPEITTLDHYALLTNDAAASARLVDAFVRNFPETAVQQIDSVMASEDFGCYGSEWQVPSVFWFFGGTDPATFAAAAKSGSLNSLPANHHPAFAPVLHPTLETGVMAMIVAAHAWLGAAQA